MSLSKTKKTGKVESFKFGELVPNSALDKDIVDKVLDYSFSDLQHASKIKNEITESEIRSEREFEKKSPFVISSMVREHRGIVDQENQDYEKRVNSEISTRMKVIKGDAYNEGFNTGKEEGYKEAFEQAKLQFDQKVEELGSLIEGLVAQSEEVLVENKKNIYRMVKNLTKWVLLKEISDESYLPKLLEKLVYEMNTKNNLVIRVNSRNFDEMPGVIEKVEEKIGQLKNSRLEIELDLDKPGIILETENGIIDGSIEAQFASIDKLFENVGIDGTE